MGHLSHASPHTPQFRGERGKILPSVNKNFSICLKLSLGAWGLVNFGNGCGHPAPFMGSPYRLPAWPAPGYGTQTT
jgi:hypothetical protein